MKSDSDEPPSALSIWLRSLGFFLAMTALIGAARRWSGNPMTATMLGALGVSVLAGYVGIKSEKPSRAAWLKTSVAALLALLISIISVAVAAALGADLSMGTPSSAILFATMEALAIAYRDEIWLRGVAFYHADQVGLPAWQPLVYGALAGVAAVALEPGVGVVGVALVTTSSLFFASLWLRAKTAWAPIAAHFVWVWLCDALLAGELLNLDASAGRLSATHHASGAVALAASVAFVGAAAFVLRSSLFRPKTETPV